MEEQCTITSIQIPVTIEDRNGSPVPIIGTIVTLSQPAHPTDDDHLRRGWALTDRCRFLTWYLVRPALRSYPVPLLLPSNPT
jgi:hypothetical protein